MVLYATIDDADIGRLKIFVIPWVVFEPQLAKFKHYRMIPNYTKLWPFWSKGVNYFWQSVDAILEEVSVAETIVVILNRWLKDFRLSVFPK